MRLRSGLGDFISIECFKAAIRGMEDILGEQGAASLLIAAGRQRGRDLATSRNLTGTTYDAATLAEFLRRELGSNGTRLCEIVSVEETKEGGYLVQAKETVCMSGEPPGSARTCTYTMGAVIGVIEVATGKRLVGKHVRTVLQDSETDDFLISLSE